MDQLTKTRETLVVEYPKRRQDVSCREVDGEMVILDRAAEKVHQLNPTATFIWKLCDGAHRAEDITQKVAEAFGIDAATVSRDVERALQELVRLRLVGAFSGEVMG